MLGFQKSYEKILKIQFYINDRKQISKSVTQPSLVVHDCNPKQFGSLRQEDHWFKASLNKSKQTIQ